MMYGLVLRLGREPHGLARGSRQYKNLMKHLGWKDLGNVLAGGVMKVGDIKDRKELKDAYELGKAVAAGDGL